MKHQIKKLTERITLLYGIHAECCIYLVEGDKRALLIDTGLGAVDMQSEIAELTSLPYDVVNTHGHGDHTGGNIYYPAVYMHEGAREDARGFLALNKTVLSEEEVAIIEAQLAKGSYEIHCVSDGFTFDLGDRHLEVLSIPGHSPGCIALLDHEDRVLFSGDCFVKSMPIQMVVPGALTIREYLDSLHKLQSREDEFDWLCTGHDEQLEPKTFLDEVTAACEKLVTGELSGEDIELPPVYGDTRAKLIKEKDFTIAYRPWRVC
ncbi:MAG: MBL fold metallo-hydrolase [Lachnospiraceae bacterium]|nr:MBL fold metallo-hydrolase [Lachnospiraceae bacterium]